LVDSPPLRPREIHVSKTKPDAYLPVVRPETCYSVQHSVPEDGTTKFIKKMLRSIRKENPMMADWIAEWSQEAGSADARAHSGICGVIVYMLLRSQAEADQMAEDWKLS
jgi:hypothetical protein